MLKFGCIDDGGLWLRDGNSQLNKLGFSALFNHLEGLFLLKIETESNYLWFIQDDEFLNYLDT